MIRPESPQLDFYRKYGFLESKPTQSDSKAIRPGHLSFLWTAHLLALTFIEFGTVALNSPLGLLQTGLLVLVLLRPFATPLLLLMLLANLAFTITQHPNLSSYAYAVAAFNVLLVILIAVRLPALLSRLKEQG